MTTIHFYFTFPSYGHSMNISKMVFWYIVYCMQHLAKPWLFFQLNSLHFNAQKRIFSKVYLNELVPLKWRLKHGTLGEALNGELSFPLFLKPEWGQNSYGICRVNDHKELVDACYDLEVRGESEKYFAQECAKYKNEFEIFYVKQAGGDECAFFNVVQTCNKSGDNYPINSVHNGDTSYEFIDLSDEQKEAIWAKIKHIGSFRVARVGLMADDIDEILEGRFEVIETNIFTPMPLCLLDNAISKQQKKHYIKEITKALALLTASLQEQTNASIFFSMAREHYRVKDR